MDFEDDVQEQELRCIMPLLTVAEVAERLRISPSLVYEMVQGGKLPHIRFGKPGRRGTIRVAEEDVAEMIASCKSYGAEPEPPLNHLR